MFDPKTMQRRFHELGAQREAIHAKSGPLRAKLETATQLYDSVSRPLISEIKVVEAGLYDLDQERALIARALGGKTGAA